METFFEQKGLAAGSSVVLESREAALAFPQGNLELACCQGCGFVGNLVFDAHMAEVAARHEDSQAFSGTYVQYMNAMAASLVERHDLRGRRVVEVGCGQGEFLAALCRLGDNEGIGFDPVFDASRGVLQGLNARGEAREYEPDGLDADLVCCKMTLEHIPAVGPFVADLARGLRNGARACVQVQVPESGRILRECAFEDVYYEHCSYFTPGSLARLFRAQGIWVDNLEISYGGQHLTIEGHPSADAHAQPALPLEETPQQIQRLAEQFTALHAERVAYWQQALAGREHKGPVACAQLIERVYDRVLAQRPGRPSPVREGSPVTHSAADAGKPR
jgi:SAM-dependent methyltransferase